MICDLNILIVDKPLDNYMDYSDDSCLDQFTPGQIARLTEQLITYRAV